MPSYNADCMKVYTRTLIFCLFSLWCTAAYPQEPPKLRIDLDRAYGGPFSDFLENIEYIPLENTKNSECGQISNLILTDSSYVITDRDTKSILFFSTSGRFLKRISKSGTLNATGALYDAQKNIVDIVFESNDRTKILFENYSLIGNFIARGNINDIDNNIVFNSLVVDKDNFWLRHQISKTDTVPAFYFSQYKSNIKIRSAVPFDSLNAFGLYHLTKELGYFRLPVIKANNFYFSTPLTHKLYKVDAVSGTAEALFQLVFPAKFGIKSTLLTVQDRMKMDSIVHTSWFNDRTVLGLENVVYDQKKLIFKTHTGLVSRYGSDGAVIARNFLYRFQDNRLVAFEKISPDVSTYFLPFRYQGTISTEGFYFKDNYLYTHLSSLEMFAAYEANKGKKPQYPEALLKYFKAQNRKSNPVIVRMKLKE